MNPRSRKIAAGRPGSAGSWRLGVIAALVATLAAPAGTAHAAPPSNDDISRATVISGFGTHLNFDSSQATSAASDPEYCDMGATTWFRFTPPRSSRARVATLSEQYSTVFAVYRGSPGALEPVACSYQDWEPRTALQIPFRAGQTYYIAVGSCCDSSATGGRGMLSLYWAATMAASGGVTQLRTGVVSGRLYVSGTVSCTNPATAEIYFTVSQRVSSGVARASGGATVQPCMRSARRWSAVLDSETDYAFRTGTATAFWNGWAHDGFSETELAEGRANLTVTRDNYRAASQ
jgi:hypothetical protein